MKYEIRVEDIRTAWSQIGMTSQGQLARLLLVDMLMSGIPPGMKAGAVREWSGRMRLARELLNLMDAESNGSAAGRPTDHPSVIIRTSEPAGERTRGSVRRVPAVADGDPD